MVGCADEVGGALETYVIVPPGVSKTNVSLDPRARMTDILEKFVGWRYLNGRFSDKRV